MFTKSFVGWGFSLEEFTALLRPLFVFREPTSKGRRGGKKKLMAKREEWRGRKARRAWEEERWSYTLQMLLPL